jgi:hypothetical protein
MRVRARLYTRVGCHLCEQAETDLRQLQARVPHQLELVDISGDPGLEQLYGARVPVISVGGREYGAPLDKALLERALREASRRAEEAERGDWADAGGAAGTNKSQARSEASGVDWPRESR